MKLQPQNRLYGIKFIKRNFGKQILSQPKNKRMCKITPNKIL